MTRQEISNRLERWHGEAERIMALFDSRGQRVEAKDQETAKVVFNGLKDELEAEYKRLSPLAVEETLSPDESAFYKPAVHEAFVALSHIRKNSTPDAGWFNALDDVLICVEQYKDVGSPRRH